MDYRNAEGLNEGEGDFHGNRGCFKTGDERMCNKPGQDPEGMSGNFDQRGRDGDRFDGDREGRFEGDGPGGFDRAGFDRDDNNRGDDEERRHRRDD